MVLQVLFPSIPNDGGPQSEGARLRCVTTVTSSRDDNAPPSSLSLANTTREVQGAICLHPMMPSPIHHTTSGGDTKASAILPGASSPSPRSGLHAPSLPLQTPLTLQA